MYVKEKFRAQVCLPGISVSLADESLSGKQMEHPLHAIAAQHRTSKEEFIMGKYFGTDGFRGEANVNLTVEHAYKVGRFLGWYYGTAREKDFG